MSPTRAPSKRSSPKKPAAGVTDLTGRIKARRQSVWKQRLKIATVLVTVLAVLGAGVWFVYYSGYLSIKRVKVTGLKSLTTDKVTAAAQAPIGQPTFAVDTKPIAERVIQLPQVASVKVSAVLTGTVEIAVVERTAAFVAKVPGGLVLVDAQGNAFLPVENPPAGLSAASLDSVSQRDLLKDLATVSAALPPELRSATMAAKTRDSITLELPDGKQAFWGSAEESGSKSKVLTKLMAAVNAKVYDVSAPARPVTR